MTARDTIPFSKAAPRLFGAALLFLSLIPLIALHAAVLTPAGTGLPETAANAGYQTRGTSVPQFVGVVVNAALGIIGVVFLVLIVYGGMLWMLSEGDETKVGSARGLIFHSIIGLILVLSAYAITSFVVGSLIKNTLN